MKHAFTKNNQRQILAWYDSNKRSMAWRETSDPYRIWISEIMLQQTQVKTVHDYYRRFVKRFPTVHSLAKAESHDVMKMWEGLGYYSRARHLHRASQMIVSDYHGHLPDSRKELLKLPGIGEYTAGAILSIAYKKREPIVDGNVIRFFSRFFHITENVDSGKTRKQFWNIAEDILPQQRIDDFNQALMELGALICTPRNPDCIHCPLNGDCQAFRLHLQEELPVRSPKKQIPHLDVTAAIIWKGEHLLITLRPAKGLLGGLWEFPGGKLEANESLEECLIREIREELDIFITIKTFFLAVKHAYSHFRITLHVYECQWVEGDPKPLGCDDSKWIPVDDLDEFAFPAADHAIIKELKQRYGG